MRTRKTYSKKEMVEAVAMNFAGLKQTAVGHQLKIPAANISRWSLDHDIALEAGRLLDKAKADALARKAAQEVKPAKPERKTKIVKGITYVWVEPCERQVGYWRRQKNQPVKIQRQYTPEGKQALIDANRRHWESMTPEQRAAKIQKMMAARKR